MRGWFVDQNTGRPVLLTPDRSSRPDLSGKPFITSRLPPGLHDENRGKFAKWDFVAQQWVTDTQREQEFQDKRNAFEQIELDAKAAFQDLSGGGPFTAGQVAEAVVKIFRYIVPKIE